MVIRAKCVNCGKVYYMNYSEWANQMFKCYCGCENAEIVKYADISAYKKENET